MSLAQTHLARRSFAAALGEGGWLSFAATPAFAFMMLYDVASPSASDLMCKAMHGGSPLSGMAAMYGLMSAFHLSPWLRLITNLSRSSSRSSNREGESHPRVG